MKTKFEYKRRFIFYAFCAYSLDFIINIHILIKNPKQVTMIIEFTSFSDKLVKLVYEVARLSISFSLLFKQGNISL